MASGMMKPALEAAGWKVTDIWYPADATDLSSVGTKIVAAGCDAVSGASGPLKDSLLNKVARQAGFTGPIVFPVTVEAVQMLQLVPKEDIEGVVGASWDVEIDTAEQNAASKEFKAAYIAKYGKWDGPEVEAANAYWVLKAALAKAGTLDTDKVAEVIASGLTWESPCGSGQMIARPDKGISRTVMGVTSMKYKLIKNGEATLIGQTSLEEAKAFLEKYLATPSAK
jgi:ABC-type branched-subunit amino acid transport system substrate-binding protein